MSDQDRPETQRVAFCQNCGRALTADELRNVGTAVFCEPCLVAKVAAADKTGAATGSGYGYGTGAPGASYPYAGGGAPLPPRVGSVPNPGLAALLGFIPGVGAFYNGQYAKGIVHLVVFAILTTLSDRNGIFGLFVAGWIFYQVIEAYHTARARREGTPLPNPFGLNDIGERLGFGRAWPGTVAPAPDATMPGATGPTETVPGAAEYTAPGAGYAAAPPPPGYASYAPPPQAAWGMPPVPEPFGVPVPGEPPFSPVRTSASRVPTGAIFLIGLGVVFLIGNSGLFRGFPVHRLIPFLLIGFGVWLFVRKMTELGGGLSDDGTPTYRYRLYRAARGSIWVVLVGVLFLLDSFDILSWGRSWPLFIIVGGLTTFFERTLPPPPVPLQYGYVPPAGPAAAAPAAAAAAGAGTSPVVPTASDQREGS